MASGAIRDQILKQRNEARQEAQQQQTKVLGVLGRQYKALLDAYVAAEIRALEWNEVWRHYDKAD